MSGCHAAQVYPVIPVWSTSNLSGPLTFGFTFSVTGDPDLMFFKDNERVFQQGDLGPAFPRTVEPNQSLLRTLGSYDANGTHCPATILTNDA